MANTLSRSVLRVVEDVLIEHIQTQKRVDFRQGSSYLYCRKIRPRSELGGSKICSSFKGPPTGYSCSVGKTRCVQVEQERQGKEKAFESQQRAGWPAVVKQRELSG